MGYELNEMQQMDGEVDANDAVLEVSKDGDGASKASTNPTDLFERIRMARVVANTAARKKWATGFTKATNGGKLFDVLRSATEEKMWPRKSLMGKEEDRDGGDRSGGSDGGGGGGGGGGGDGSGRTSPANTRPEVVDSGVSSLLDTNMAIQGETTAAGLKGSGSREANSTVASSHAHSMFDPSHSAGGRPVDGVANVEEMHADAIMNAIHMLSQQMAASQQHLAHLGSQLEALTRGSKVHVHAGAAGARDQDEIEDEDEDEDEVAAALEGEARAR